MIPFVNFSLNRAIEPRKCCTNRGTSDSFSLLKPTASAKRIATMREAKLFDDFVSKIGDPVLLESEPLLLQIFARSTISGSYLSFLQFLTTVAVPPGPSPDISSHTAIGIIG